MNLRYKYILLGKHFTGGTKLVSAAEDYRKRSNVGNFYLNAKSIRKL